MCSFCNRPDGELFLVNAEGGYGFPELWSCMPCLLQADEGSIAAGKRDRLYGEAADRERYRGMYP